MGCGEGTARELASKLNLTGHVVAQMKHPHGTSPSGCRYQLMAGSLRTRSEIEHNVNCAIPRVLLYLRVFFGRHISRPKGLVILVEVFEELAVEDNRRVLASFSKRDLKSPGQGRGPRHSPL